MCRGLSHRAITSNLSFRYRGYIGMRAVALPPIEIRTMTIGLRYKDNADPTTEREEASTHPDSFAPNKNPSRGISRTPPDKYTWVHQLENETPIGGIQSPSDSQCQSDACSRMNHSGAPLNLAATFYENRRKSIKITK